MLASCFLYDRTIKLWNKNTGDLLRNLSGHGGPVYTFAFDNNDILAAGSVDSTIKLWSG
jgi:WD40 repeat protein